MVERMRAGSVIVDLAAASGGNCELTVDGEEVEHNGVLVIGAGDLPSRVADHRQRPLRPQRHQPARPAAARRRGAARLRRRHRGRHLRHRGRRGPPRPDPRPPRRRPDVTGGPLDILVIFVLAAFVGFEVISKVPSILHTPLMSGSNAIHGIILVGSHGHRRRGPRAAADQPGPGGGDPGHPQHRGRGGGDRPHAGDVQRARPHRPARLPTASRRREPDDEGVGD